MSILLMKIIEDLKKAGFPAKMERAPGAGGTELLAISVNVHVVRFALVRRQRAPYASEVPKLKGAKLAMRPYGRPMLIAPNISATVQRLLTRQGWSWADERGNYDIRHEHVILRQVAAATLPVSRLRAGIPQGRGSLSMVRRLISAPDPSVVVSATALAETVGVSQAAASQLLGALEKLEAVELVFAASVGKPVRLE